MNKGKAKLVKHKTIDGLMEIFEDIPLGKIYEVDLDSIEVVDGFNFEKDISWKNRKIISTINDGILPLELLEII